MAKTQAYVHAVARSRAAELKAQKAAGLIAARQLNGEIQPNLAETAQHTGRMLKSNEENFKGLGTPAKVLQLLSAPTAERSVSFISSQLHM